MDGFEEAYQEVFGEPFAEPAAPAAPTLGDAPRPDKVKPLTVDKYEEFTKQRWLSGESTLPEGIFETDQTEKVLRQALAAASPKERAAWVSAADKEAKAKTKRVLQIGLARDELRQKRLDDQVRRELEAEQRRHDKKEARKEKARQRKSLKRQQKAIERKRHNSVKRERN